MAFMTAIAGALSPFATALGIGGTVVSAIGQINAGNAVAASSEYNARVAERDAVVADQNRKYTLEATQRDVEDRRREGRRQLAAVRASYGNAGVELAGSPLDVLADTALEQELDVSRVEQEGRMRGREGALQMLGLGESAKLSRMEGKSAKNKWGVIGAVAGGIGQTLAQTA